MVAFVASGLVWQLGWCVRGGVPFPCRERMALESLYTVWVHAGTVTKVLASVDDGFAGRGLEDWRRM